jgi:quercetin dioxygenase-like cupin family protein
MHRLFAAIALFSALSFAGLAATASSPSLAAEPEPQVVYESTFPMPSTLTPPNGDSTLVHYVVEFPPGGQTPYHQHPFGCVATMIEGQIQNRFRTSGSVALAGKTLVTPKDEIGRHTNDSSTNRAVYFAACFARNADAYLVLDTTAAPPIIGPRVLFARGMAVSDLPSQFNLVQRVIDFSPGATTGNVQSNGTGLFTVLSGQLTVHADGMDQVLRTGDTFYQRPGNTHIASNSESTTTRVVATYAVPMGVKP